MLPARRPNGGLGRAGEHGMGWTQIAPTVAAAFLAALVECVEALTIVLAVGTVRGWRSGATHEIPLAGELPSQG